MSSVKLITEDLTKGRKSLYLRVYVNKKQITNVHVQNSKTNNKLKRNNDNCS